MLLNAILGVQDGTVASYCAMLSVLTTVQRNNIVVVEYEGQKTGFVVDELLGEHQTVIKPLGKVFQNLRGISGATILGNGEVAMIIDVPALVGLASEDGRAGGGARNLH